MAELTVSEICKRLGAADSAAFSALEAEFSADGRKGVVKALAAARRRIQADLAEQARMEALFAFDCDMLNSRGGGLLVGLDEVGRGPIAGPLAVGATVFDLEDAADLATELRGLNDSKQVKPADRESLALRIHEAALAWTVAWIEPSDIDGLGMSAALRKAFSQAIAAIERSIGAVDVVLVDGNPLGLDPREVNVVKGDGRSASIAAASIVAKVARDRLMDEMALRHPGYGFEHNKGYGSAAHEQAIRDKGLSPIHRKSFCSKFLQESLF